MEKTLHEQKATELFRRGFNCSQSVFAAFSDVTGIDEETALKLSCPLGGGFGRLREVCGAVSGMLMAYGAVYGNPVGEDQDAKTACYEVTRALCSDFKNEFGSIICKDLLKGLIDPSTFAPSVRTEEFYARRPCEKCIAYCARLLDEKIFK